MKEEQKQVQSLLNHLTKTYSVDEAREILIQKYPNMQKEIEAMNIETTEIKTEAFTAKDAKPKTPKKTKKVTNAARARELFAAAEDKSRNAIIDLFMRELGQNRNVASVYYYNVAPKVTRVSKLSAAREIFRTAEDKTRDAIVTTLMTKLGQTKTQATGYYYIVRRANV